MLINLWKKLAKARMIQAAKRSRRTTLSCEDLESRTNPSTTHIVAASVEYGAAPIVSVYDGATTKLKFTVNAFESTFTGGVRVAVGDVDGDGTDDLIVGAGRGGSARVRVFSGVDGTPLQDFLAGDETNRGGATVAAADFDGDGKADLVVGAVKNGQEVIQILRGYDGQSLRTIQPFGASIEGVNVAAGDFDGDGTPDVVIGAGFGGGPRLTVVSGKTGDVLLNTFAYESTFRGGLQVAAGDLDGDGKVEIVTAAGPGGGPRIIAFQGGSGDELHSFFAYEDSSARNGVQVSVFDVDNDGTNDIVTANGPGQAPQLRAFNGTTLARLADPQYPGLPFGAIAITPQNNVPVAVNDSATTHMNTGVVISVLVNDDLGDEPTSITGFDAVSVEGGVVVDNGNGSLTYTPPSGFVGTDSFTYTITDVDGESSTATVTITVTNNLPVANADSATTGVDVPVQIFVLLNDDLGDEPTSITGFDAVSAEGGTIVDNMDGTLTYTPPSGFSGSDSFTYTITDADGDMSTATVTIDVVL
ncbi:MAG: Ig-like domain-containing protein [Gemmataceae bacterium]